MVTRWRRAGRPAAALTVVGAAFAALLAGCGFGGGAADVAAERACYAVTRVVDGDTFKIDAGAGKDDTVRLLGVDTPETVKPDAPVEPYGPEASDFAKRLLTGRTVCLETDVRERDPYGRLLAYAYLEDGTFVNERLLAEGYATVLTIPPNVRFADRFVAAQREAREAGRGLWAAPDAEAPGAAGGGASGGGAAGAASGAAGGGVHVRGRRDGLAERGEEATAATGGSWIGVPPRYRHVTGAVADAGCLGWAP